ncbi:hypothetical protein KL951_001067 [Ogataea haglerorum]|nr:hypothetical protein KL951_001067 [Ogataea haglerorum]
MFRTPAPQISSIYLPHMKPRHDSCPAEQERQEQSCSAQRLWPFGTEKKVPGYQFHQRRVHQNASRNRVQDALHDVPGKRVRVVCGTHADADGHTDRGREAVQQAQQPRPALLVCRERDRRQPGPNAEPLKRLVEHHRRVQHPEVVVAAGAQVQANHDRVEHDAKLQDQESRDLRPERHLDHALVGDRKVVLANGPLSREFLLKVVVAAVTRDNIHDAHSPHRAVLLLHVHL